MWIRTSTSRLLLSTGGTYTVTFSGNGKNQVQGNSNAFATTETDKGGPYYGQTLEVYYHTFGPTAQYPNGYTAINVYPNGTALPPSSSTPSPLWAMKVVAQPNGTLTGS
jgi:hypothetical protein